MLFTRHYTFNPTHLTAYRMFTGEQISRLQDFTGSTITRHTDHADSSTVTLVLPPTIACLVAIVTVVTCTQVCAVLCTGTCMCMLKWSMFIAVGCYHSRCVCMFRLSTERTSLTNLSASSIGSRLRRAVSVGFENHDVIGNALSATAQDIKC